MRDCKDFELLMNEKCFDWVSKCKEKFTIKAYEEGNKELSKILIKTLRKKYKLTKNQIKRVIEIMKFTNFHENQQAFEFFKEEVKERLKLANKSEFYPFVNKKLPYIAFDGNNNVEFLIISFYDKNLGLQALINPTIYKNFNEAEG